jgi:hypothetical protein
VAVEKFFEFALAVNLPDGKFAFPTLQTVRPGMFLNFQHVGQ